MPAKGSVLRLLFPMRCTDYSPLPLPCLRRTVWAFAGQSAYALRLSGRGRRPGRASLRPPPKLDVQFSRIQLSR